MAQLITPTKTYDVCIIGSGAGGGTAAKVLTEGGLSVVMLEAGPLLHPEKDFKEHVCFSENLHTFLVDNANSSSMVDDVTSSSVRDVVAAVS